METLSTKGQPKARITRDRSTCLAAQIKASPCQQGDDSQCDEITGSQVLPETVNTPAAIGKFLHLKYLEIVAVAPKFSEDYDFYSLVSFLDASPALETFILRIEIPTIRSDSIVEDSDGDSSHQRCLSERCHDNLKNVMITGFCSAKSMIALTIHIIEKTKLLECLTLDTTRGHDRRFVNVDKCLRLKKDALLEAEKARIAIRRYVEGRVPHAVKLKIIEPCSKCIC